MVHLSFRSTTIFEKFQGLLQYFRIFVFAVNFYVLRLTKIVVTLSEGASIGSEGAFGCYGLCKKMVFSRTEA